MLYACWSKLDNRVTLTTRDLEEIKSMERPGRE
jgi:hypothetical protein